MYVFHKSIISLYSTHDLVIFWNVMISNSLSCTRETKKMLCSVPGLYENRLSKETIHEPFPVCGKHGPNWRIPNFAGSVVRAGEFVAGEKLGSA